MSETHSDHTDHEIEAKTLAKVSACPRCGGECAAYKDRHSGSGLSEIQCKKCRYRWGLESSVAEAIAAHNDVAGKVRDAEKLRAIVDAGQKYYHYEEQDYDEFTTSMTLMMEWQDKARTFLEREAALAAAGKDGA